MKHKIVFIVGPTSSGKSAVAARLAEDMNGEVISCDSMQVYGDMDIITQAPSPEFTRGIKHHLVGEIRPEDEFSASDFTEKASLIINDVIARGKVPVIAGGTGLYVKSLVDGLFEGPSRDENIRREYEKKADVGGVGFLYGELKNVDPVSAGKIHPNDLRRIIRALEVYRLTGERLSDKKKGTKGIYDKYDCKIFGLDIPRDKLYERINRTVERMLDSGLVDEVEGLLARNLSLTAEKAIGIKEVRAFLSGECSFDEMTEELKKNTRNYAKRQLTWFRQDKRIIWIDADRPLPDIINGILTHL